MIDLNNDNYKEIFRNKIVLVDFYASWCIPCKIIARNLRGLEKKIKSDKLIFAKADIDNNQLLVDKYELSCWPTLILFKNEKELNRHVGCLSSKKIKEFIKNSLDT